MRRILRNGAWLLLVPGFGCSPRPEIGPPARKIEKISAVAVLPIPTGEIPPSEQEQIFTAFAEGLHKHYRVRVLAGRAFGRAIFGTRASGLEEATKAFETKVQDGKTAQQQLQVNTALGALEQAKAFLPLCAAELRKPSLLTDLFLYYGLAQLAQNRTEQAQAAFRQAVSFNNALTVSEKDYQPEQAAAFETAKRQLLSGKPTAVEILSSPPGATVLIDGVNVGLTPAPAIPLYPGLHYVRLELPGYSVWTQNFPDGVPPTSVGAQLFRVFPEPAPAELVPAGRATGSLSQPLTAYLSKLADFYQVEALLITRLIRKDKELHFGIRLFLPDTGLATDIKHYSLGGDPGKYQQRLALVTRTLKELRRSPPRKAKSK